jgi:glutamate/tyrosine decarboxylase-like PLP-dependent enzyme
MKDRILRLQELSTVLEPNRLERKQLQEEVIAYTERFLDKISSEKAYIVTEDKGAALWDYPIQEKGRDIEHLLSLIAENVDRPGLNPASGGHIAYIPGGGIYPSALGDYMADVTNRYAGVFYGGPGAVRMENILIRWLCDLFGLPKEAGGNLTSGGSIANLVGVVTARDYKGLKGADFHKTVIYTSQQAHHCTTKAVKISGLYEATIRNIPLDEHFRMNPDELQKAIQLDKENGLIPFLVIASAGTTDTGAIDPLDTIADICASEEVWFHVDAAYGGFFILTPECEADFKGIERADSIVIDPHKGLFLPYGSGAVLVRNAKWLYDSQHMEASYMQDTYEDMEELSPADMSPELTKPFRGMRLWLPLQLFGVAPFRACLSEKIWLCRYFYEEIQKLGFEVGPYPELSVMISRYVPEGKDANQFNLDLQEAVRQDGRVFLSSTTIDGTIYIRLAVLSFRTHLTTIDTCLAILKEQVAILMEKG